MVRPGKKLKKMIMILGITGAVYGGFKYLLPLVIPFLCAYLAALWLRPPVRYLERRLFFRFRGREYHLPAALIGGVILLALGLSFSGLIYYGGSRLLSQLRLLSARLPDWLAGLDAGLTGVCLGLERRLGLRDGYLVDLAEGLVRSAREAFKQSTMPFLMTNSMNLLKGVGKLAVFLVVFYVAFLMTLSEMDEIREKKSRSAFHREFSLLSRRMVTVSSAWLRTQLIIMTITSMVCILGLFLIGNPYCLLFGIGIGILDALPVFGTGSVLIPWGIALCLKAKWGRGLMLFGLYGICYFIRELLEARVMGNQMGLSPLETFFAMYVGLQLFGIPGFLLGPMGLLMIEDLFELYRDRGESR